MTPECTLKLHVPPWVFVSALRKIFNGESLKIPRLWFFLLSGSFNIYAVAERKNQHRPNNASIH